MKNVFVYGSLMFDDVWNRVVQCSYGKRTAVLSGYKRLSVKGETYPGLVASPDGSVEGMVYLDVTTQDMQRLDRFEGEYYKKIPVTVTADDDRVLDAEVYLFKQSYKNMLSDTPWDPVHFKAHHLRQFIAKYSGFNE